MDTFLFAQIRTRNPTCHERKATQVGTLVDDKGLLIALSYHRGIVHDIHTAESTTQHIAHRVARITSLRR